MTGPRPLALPSRTRSIKSSTEGTLCCRVKGSNRASTRYLSFSGRWMPDHDRINCCRYWNVELLIAISKEQGAPAQAALFPIPWIAESGFCFTAANLAHGQSPLECERSLVTANHRQKSVARIARQRKGRTLVNLRKIADYPPSAMKLKKSAHLLPLRPEREERAGERRVVFIRFLLHQAASF